MRSRIVHFFGFLTAFVTIAALAFAFISWSGSDGQSQSLLADFFVPLMWIGSLGGFVCASILATKTAWSFYSHGKLEQNQRDRSA